MNFYFITGASRGIGKALSELLLENNENFIYGLSRSNEIVNKNYRYIKTDLKDLEKVKAFNFPELEDAESIVLINNSASKSEVSHLGNRSSDNMIENFNVNLISPALLMNNFLKKYQSYECKRMIMNISSGAAFKPMESWSTYCATKAGLAMISEVAGMEQKLNHSENPVNVFNVSPGIVDTQMQTDLRKIAPKDFSMVGTFIEYHEKHQLAKPAEVARKLNMIIQYPEKFEKVVIDIRDQVFNV
ncbi:MAG: SDR family NAD(P)-dependent oxidoreductase [Ignavibacteria bacterium]